MTTTIPRHPFPALLRVPLLGALAFLNPAAHAEDGPFLDAASVAERVIGKKLTMTRQADHQRVRWQLDKNGSLYGDNLSLGSRDTARWTNDDKGLCLKWKGNSSDRCILFRIKDGKTQMFDAATKDAVFAEVESIE